MSNWTGAAWQLASARTFLYDGWNLVLDLNAMNSRAVLCSYVIGFLVMFL